MNNAGKLTAILIAAFSLLLVFGALLTALAENGFTAFSPENTSPPDSASNPTATPIILPTKEPAPTKEPDTTKAEPTAAADKTKAPEKTKDTTATKTPTAAVTKTSKPTESGACTKPDGWKDYKVKSGDTLFAISLLFQTDVATLKTGNCLTSNQIITGKILWVPSNATLTPTKTEKPESPTKTPKPTEKPPTDGCYLLTLKHLGEGADATALPLNSVGCPTGKYKAGETISLTAAPDPGWQVGSWYNTENDSSTALTNTVIMPSNDLMAKPIYVPICYALTVTNGANGSLPLRDKTKSTGCNADEYVEGEVITFTGKPDPLYTIDTWTGTDSGTNVLTMPASAAAVHVTYVLIPPPCFTLTLGVTSGAGTVPTASASGSGCAAGEYTPGETITVTAVPTGAGVVDSWQTSLIYSEVAPGDPTVITVTMGASASSVDVTYNP